MPAPSTLKLTLAQARPRYEKNRPCAGADAPDQVIGKPDHHNEMQVGRDRVVTWGFRFPEGTLVVRCRNDRVELTNLLR